MSRFSFSKTVLFIIFFCGLISGLTQSFPANAADRKAPHLHQESLCPAVLLKNQAYFPALIKVIDAAQNEIIMSFFLFKAGVHRDSYPDIIAEHLGEAVKRGVKIKIILENSGGRDQHLDSDNRQTKDILERKGMEVYWDSPKKTTHTKLVVIDQSIVFLGSHNLTQSALKYNNELSVKMECPDLANDARNYMLSIIKEAK
jgi:phosphatidylserine/phosphatidylglycerophosphate/cardiolipin synthase-like enzyme